MESAADVSRSKPHMPEANLSMKSLHFFIINRKEIQTLIRHPPAKCEATSAVIVKKSEGIR